MTRFVHRVTATALLVWAVIGAAPVGAASLPLNQVQSFAYIIGAGPTTGGLAQAVAASPAQMVVLGAIPQGAQSARSNVDPTNSKIVLGYFDVTEASPYLEPDLFTGNTVPSWFGNKQQYYDLWSVQYWNPAWEAEVFHGIDNIIAQGYDGVLLDVLNGDLEWSANGAYGNPIYPNAVPAMATLVTDITNYVKNKNLTKPFYLIGTDPREIAQQYPSSVAGLNGIFLDSLYYNMNVTGVYEGAGGIGAGLYANIAATYSALGIPIFGSDYPPPGNATANLQAFVYYTQLGWVPTINPESQDSNILGTGPFMFMATPANTTARGAANFVNYLSGGLVSNATLIGGNQSDYFIGGSGANTITAGTGNDTIYAHPANVAVKNLITITVQADVQNVANPVLTVLVNGKPTNGPTTITGTYTNGQTQTIQVDTSALGTVSSIELDVTGPAYIDSSHYANVQPQKITFQGQTLAFNTAKFVGGAAIYGTALVISPGGSAIFGSPTLPIAAPVFGNTSDTIDGGGGVNTVIYREAKSNYTIANQADGSVLVTSASSAEGPDTLRNIQFLQFSDQTVAINSATPLRNGAVFSTAQSMSQSFLRFFNTGAAAGTVTATLSDYVTGARLGQWTSDSIPAGAELQYDIGTVEAGAGITGTKPNYYSVTLDAGMSGYFQHVLWRPADGTLTNLSTCASGVTADPSYISGVHTSLIGSGFPSSVVITNPGTTTETVSLDFYDARNGNKLGTYKTGAIPPGGELIPTVTSMEVAAGITPGAGMYHYVIKAETPFTGFLQNLVNNAAVAVVTDMTTACSLSGSAPVMPTSPLQAGAVFSTAQTTSQSFLRFFNTGTAAGTVSVTLKDYTSGNALGTWTSPSIAPLSEQQFAISTVEIGASITAAKPQYYSISVLSGFSGYYQHVLWRPTDGTLTNLSTCAAGVTADPTTISGVHTSLIGSGFPSSIAINNTGSAAATIAIDMFDARNGTKLGTYTTESIPAGGQSIPLVSDMEIGAKITPSSGMYHYALKAQTGFTGFLQNLVNNTSVGVITDMTTACAMVMASP